MILQNKKIDLDENVNLKKKNLIDSIEKVDKTKSSPKNSISAGIFVKKSARNSILPYSVFEDYLLFKCYLDKPINQLNSKVRTRQSGHLGKNN